MCILEVLPEEIVSQFFYLGTSYFYGKSFILYKSLQFIKKDLIKEFETRFPASISHECIYMLKI